MAGQLAASQQIRLQKRCRAEEPQRPGKAPSLLEWLSHAPCCGDFHLQPPKAQPPVVLGPTRGETLASEPLGGMCDEQGMLRGHSGTLAHGCCRKGEAARQL